MSQSKEYILGTDTQELFRLGVQHQIWASEAQRGWELAGFTKGHKLLDLGCGPGFCTQELAFLAGSSGTVIGVDRAKNYIDHLKRTAAHQQLNINAIHSEFDHMQLHPESLDGMYCRWAMAWIPNPKEVLKKVYHALKPGGVMVFHEYYDWSTHQTEPRKKHLEKAIASTLQSFHDSPGHIDIGRKLPRLLSEFDMKIEGIRLMPKLATPQSAIWQWPKTFYHSYFPRLVPEYLSEEEVSKALAEMDQLEAIEGASLLTPLMVEVIARKKY